MFGKDCFEVFGMFVTNVFDTKVVDHECELDGLSVMSQQAGYEFALLVAVSSEVFLQ